MSNGCAAADSTRSCEATSQVAFCQSKRRSRPRQERQPQASADPERVSNVVDVVDTIGAHLWSQGDGERQMPLDELLLSWISIFRYLSAPNICLKARVC
jgi:hypothetical protein